MILESHWKNIQHPFAFGYSIISIVEGRVGWVRGILKGFLLQCRSLFKILTDSSSPSTPESIVAG